MSSRDEKTTVALCAGAHGFSNRENGVSVTVIKRDPNNHVVGVRVSHKPVA